MFRCATRLYPLAVHIVLVEVFLLVFRMGIFSVVYANILFAFMMCLLNGRTIARCADYRQEYKKTMVLPTVCALIMGAGGLGRVSGGLFLCSRLFCITAELEWLLWYFRRWLQPLRCMACF